MFTLNYKGKLQGSSNHLDGAYDIDYAVIGSHKILGIVSYDSAKVVFINVDTPTAPVVSGYLLGSGSPNFLAGASGIVFTAISGTDYAVAVSRNDNALLIINVSNPATPSLTAAVSGAGTPYFLDGAYKVAVGTVSGTEYAFVACLDDNCVSIYDISTPASPVLVGRLSGAGTPNYLGQAHDVKFIEIGGTPYVFATGYEDSSLIAIDVTDPSTPVLAGVIFGSGAPNYLSNAHSVAVTTAYAYVSAYGEDTITVIDISDPTAMSFVDMITGAGSPNYLRKPCGINAITISIFDYVVSANYLDDAITAIEADDPSALSLSEATHGEGSPYYLGGVHDFCLTTSYLYAVSYDEDTLIIFEIATSKGVSVSATWSAVTDAVATPHLGGIIDLTASWTVSTEAVATAVMSWEDFYAELDKPHFLPLIRSYMVTIYGTEVEVTDYVKDYQTLIWQIEQQYHLNEFRAGICQIELRNEDGKFDPDVDNNFFVASLGRQTDGRKTPFIIKCGYVTEDGDEILIPMFYGILVDIDTTTEDDIALIELNCASNLLRDAKANNLGDQWTDQRLYGGNSYTYLAAPPINAESSTINAANGVELWDGNWPTGFPPSGYIKLHEPSTGIDEIVFYSYKTALGFGGCMRGMFSTAPKNSFIIGSTKISLLLNDGTEPGETLFQFPTAPVVKDSITDVYSSDGDIQIYDQEIFVGLSAEQERLTGTVDYDKGILKLAAEPDNADSVYATFKTSYRNIPYHTLVKRLLKANGFGTALIEDATFYDRYGNRVPTTWQRPLNAWNHDTQYILSSTESFGIAAGRDSELYVANGTCLLKWDGDKFNLLVDLNPYYIFRIEHDYIGDRIFGIAGRRSTGVAIGLDIKRRVFCWDGEKVSFYTGEIAAYMDTYTNLSTAYDGGQWKGFSVSGGYVWFVYHVSGSDCGLARINTDGTGLTKYNLGALVAYDHGMDFVDTGDTIELFYAYDLGGGSYCCAYSTFTKNSSTWTHNGNLNAVLGHLPFDVTYHPIDDKIYLNLLWDTGTPGWWAYFISVPRNSVTHTLLWEYKENSSDFTGMQSRLCGGIYYDGYCWYVKGTGLAVGHEIDKDDTDTANGHLYKIANNVITDCGALALRLPEEEIHYVRKDVKGISAVMCYRASDNAIFFIASDMIVREKSDYGYTIGRYSPSFMPLIRLTDIDGQSVWTVLTDLAIPIGYELGVTREGEIFYRKRSGVITYLESDINNSAVTIPTTGALMSDFDDSGIMQLHQELITYSGKTANSFTGCVRGCYNSVAVAHGIPAEIWKIDNVLMNIDTPYYQRLKWAEKKPNWEEIYNYIIVKYGGTQLIFDYRKAGEVWEGCSEQVYGRLEYTINNQFLSDEDGVLAEAIGWRYYDLLHNRKGLIEAETRWQPQIDLGNQLSIYQTDRVYLDYVIARVRRIELMFSDFYVRIVTLIKPSALRNTIYDYEYY